LVLEEAQLVERALKPTNRSRTPLGRDDLQTEGDQPHC
jgi:hypothetical protein